MSRSPLILAGSKDSRSELHSMRRIAASFRIAREGPDVKQEGTDAGSKQARAHGGMQTDMQSTALMAPAHAHLCSLPPHPLLCKSRNSGSLPMMALKLHGLLFPPQADSSAGA